jgi:hypothetical protein
MWRTFDELPEYDFRRVSVALVSVNKEVFHFAADGFVMPFQFSDGGAHGWKIYSTDKV